MARRGERAKADYAVDRAVESGRLTVPDRCPCGSQRGLQRFYVSFERPLTVWWLCSACARSLSQKRKSPPYEESKRLLLEGWTTKQIAERFGMNPRSFRITFRRRARFFGEYETLRPQLDPRSLSRSNKRPVTVRTRPGPRPKPMTVRERELRELRESFIEAAESAHASHVIGRIYG